MIVIWKYDKRGTSVRYEFKFLYEALFWLRRNFHSAEWCWIFYVKEDQF